MRRPTRQLVCLFIKNFFSLDFKSFIKDFLIFSLFGHGLCLLILHTLDTAIEISGRGLRLKQTDIEISEHLCGKAKVIEIIEGLRSLTHDLVHPLGADLPDTGDSLAIDTGTTFEFVARPFRLITAIFDVCLLGKSETKVDS